MARPTSGKVSSILDELRHRIEGGLYHPGERFLSARALADRFGVSYQTAHRILVKLTHEGLLERHGGSGSYISGERPCYRCAGLIFHERARNADSFGGSLLRAMKNALKQFGISYAVAFGDNLPSRLNTALPVVWECDRVVSMLGSRGQRGIMLGQAPTPGLAGTRFDSVMDDGYFGGVCGAQLLKRSIGPKANPMMLGGPAKDRRCCERRDGFVSEFPQAEIVYADGWYFEHGVAVARRVLRNRPDGVFCANDRLAQAIVHEARKSDLPLPPLVGFDDAPIAEKLNISSIGFPRDEIANAAAQLIKRRMQGDDSLAFRQIFTPRPVIRRGPARSL